MSENTSSPKAHSSGASVDTEPDGPAASARAASTRQALLRIWHELPLRALRTALIIDAVVIGLYLLALAVASHNHNLFFLLDMEAEGNPPSWWYGTQQFLVGAVFLILSSGIFSSVRNIRDFRPLFFVAGLGFTYISLDEVGEVHEIGSRILINVHAIARAQMSLQTMLHVHHTPRGGGIWLGVYFLMGIALLIWVVPRGIEAFKLWRKPATTFLVGFGIFVFSAAILQVVGYFTKEGTGIHDVYVITEQALKIGGISIALYGATQVLAEGLTILTRQLSGERAE